MKRQRSEPPSTGTPADDQPGDTATRMLAHVARALIDGASAGTVANDPSVPNLALGFREWIERASAGTPAMPSLARGVRDLIDRAAGVKDLARQVDRGPSSPDRVVEVEPVDPAVPLQTDTAESHGTTPPASPRPVRLFHPGA